MKDIETLDTLNQLKIDLQGDVSSPLGFIAGGMHVGLRRKKKTLDGFTQRQQLLRQELIH